MGLKTKQKDDGFWDRSWKGSGAPKGAPVILDTTDLGLRGGVKGRGKPLPWFCPVGKQGKGQQGPSKPPVAQRAGGINGPIVRGKR